MFKVDLRHRQRRLLGLVLCVMVAVALLLGSPAPRAQGAPAGGGRIKVATTSCGPTPARRHPW